MNTLFMHCRPGFEGEVCSEIADLGLNDRVQLLAC